MVDDLLANLTINLTRVGSGFSLLTMIDWPARRNGKMTLDLAT
jgi:hypothetical protein